MLARRLKVSEDKKNLGNGPIVTLVDLRTELQVVTRLDDVATKLCFNSAQRQ
jgi:hypothetical protein